MPPIGGSSDALVRVDKLKLAAWLRFNHESLVSRDTLQNGKIAYYFRQTNSIGQLIQTWEEGQTTTIELRRFASIVSYEIRLALKERSRKAVANRTASGSR